MTHWFFQDWSSLNFRKFCQMINKKNVAKKNNVFKEERGGGKGVIFFFRRSQLFYICIIISYFRFGRSCTSEQISRVMILNVSNFSLFSSPIGLDLRTQRFRYRTQRFRSPNLEVQISELKVQIYLISRVRFLNNKGSNLLTIQVQISEQSRFRSINHLGSYL